MATGPWPASSPRRDVTEQASRWVAVGRDANQDEAADVGAFFWLDIFVATLEQACRKGELEEGRGKSKGRIVTCKSKAR